MKTLRSVLLVAVLPLISFGQTTNVIIHDTWADGNRTSTGADGSDIDSAWYSSSASTLTVPSAGDLRGTVGTGSSFWTTYFPSAVTLNNPGDALSLTWVFTPTGLNSGNANQGFNLAVANTPGTQLTSDGSSPSQQIYAGYAMFMNMSPALSNSFSLREWILGGSGALLGTSANWGANGASGSLASINGTGQAGYSSGFQYTFTMTFSLDTSTNGTLDVIATIAGSGLNGSGVMSVTNYDSTPNSLTFNTFAIRPTSAATSASQFDSSLLSVEFIQPVPEPSIIALSGVAFVGLAAAIRRRRK
ncbi:MAG TPA: PEP-CTERM sorting domain-containing protein [Verrucomicrobiae bacterium]|nr:PEP-CTERM sorting domain-containing protein [Verrucomicrobiae bacterium]